ncbi:2Fe-2S iron-sulfur cluster binding domain-containing protein [Zavarzinia compransoris]|uniref:2Fe-2S iron-sulfur cluster binding domain-containing protein n=1 Tax=Zavarzinia marina TaxID=2911065 RepID=UPI001F2335E6|nr:2Fe-2S iron-sulfur cluster binding domain-containing protein [Zavarzinia marina]MCF4165743.1 2Fe-2S iron-sulfur cluster binding domain-containing protein [Zavarzinia marina]
MAVHHTIEVEDCGTRFRCPAGEGLLQAMERLGARSIPVGCRNGGCGLCLVRVTQGAFKAGPMSCRHVPPGHTDLGLALACRIYPQSDLRVRLATDLDRQVSRQSSPEGQNGR